MENKDKKAIKIALKTNTLAAYLAMGNEDKYSCTCGRADSRFDVECTYCGDLFTD